MFLKDMLSKISMTTLLYICAGCFALLALACKLTDTLPASMFRESLVFAVICAACATVGLVVGIVRKWRQARNAPPSEDTNGKDSTR